MYITIDIPKINQYYKEMVLKVKPENFQSVMETLKNLNPRVEETLTDMEIQHDMEVSLLYTKRLEIINNENLSVISDLLKENNSLKETIKVDDDYFEELKDNIRRLECENTRLREIGAVDSDYVQELKREVKVLEVDNIALLEEVTENHEYIRDMETIILDIEKLTRKIVPNRE